MGKQVRKIWSHKKLVDAHLFSNFVTLRIYRWSTYFAHPTMKVGHPFKARWTGRPPIGMLLVPDILKFKVPAPFAFVKANPEKEARETSKHPRNSHIDEPKLLSSGDYKFTKECQLTVNNFNNCIRNSSLETCAYYANYLKFNCHA